MITFYTFFWLFFTRTPYLLRLSSLSTKPDILQSLRKLLHCPLVSRLPASSIDTPGPTSTTSGPPSCRTTSPGPRPRPATQTLYYPPSHNDTILCVPTLSPSLPVPGHKCPGTPVRNVDHPQRLTESVPYRTVWTYDFRRDRRHPLTSLFYLRAPSLW